MGLYGLSELGIQRAILYNQRGWELNKFLYMRAGCSVGGNIRRFQNGPLLFSLPIQMPID